MDFHGDAGQGYAVFPQMAIGCMPQLLSKDERGNRGEKMVGDRNIHVVSSWEFPDAVVFSDGIKSGVKY